MGKENDYIWLNQDQALCFMHGIQLIRDKNPYFNDPIAIEYEKFCLERAEEIAGHYFTFSEIKLLLPHAKDFKISKSLFDYLTRLTGMDVFNKDYVSKIAKIIAEEANKALENSNKTLRMK